MTPPAVTLRPADYERLLRLSADVRIAELEGAAVVAKAQQRIEAANAARARHLEMLTASYEDFHAEDVHYRPDDATCTLYPLAPNQEGTR